MLRTNLTHSSEQSLARRLSRNWSATWTLLRWWARFIFGRRSITCITQACMPVTWQQVLAMQQKCTTVWQQTSSLIWVIHNSNDDSDNNTKQGIRGVV